jgi:peptidoglycan/LPS O-acetylase OafA/YrhL
MLINAAVFRFFGADPVANLAGLVIAWGASIAAGWLLYQLVERRTERLLTAGDHASSPRDKSLEYALETPIETPR